MGVPRGRNNAVPIGLQWLWAPLGCQLTMTWAEQPSWDGYPQSFYLLTWNKLISFASDSKLQQGTHWSWGKWKERGLVNQGRLMLSETEDVEVKMISSFFNYQTIQLWSKFSELTRDFNILYFFYCSDETEIYIFTKVCLSECKLLKNLKATSFVVP